ncbi:MAG: ATP-binding protein [Candidatus Acidiferrales bacterium]
MDLKTNEVRLSPQLMRIYELAPDHEWSEDIYWDRMHPGDRARVHLLTEKSMAAGKPYDFVARYCAPDGRVRVHLAHTVPLLDEQGKVTKAMGVIQDVTEHAASHQELCRLSQQLMREQDSQRRHLARELHESAGQSLAALKMTLGRVREALPEGSDSAASLLESAALLADGAVREVRTISYLLHPPMLDDAGLGPALRWYTTGFTERSGIRATLEISEPFPRYSQEIETTVFRVVQEALTNVHRYSGSATAEIRVLHDDSQLRVEIRDRGCGIPPSADPLHRRTELGVGISGMRERVKQLDGIFEFDGAAGTGSTVRVLLPVSPSKPARPKFTPPGARERVPNRRNYAPQTRSGR